MQRNYLLIFNDEVIGRLYNVHANAINDDRQWDCDVYISAIRQLLSREEYRALLKITKMLT